MNSPTFFSLLTDGIPETTIHDELVEEAMCNVDLNLRHAVDVAYFCASMNLLNAWMKVPRDGYKPNYVFKGAIAKRMEGVVKRPIDGVEVYVSLAEKVMYVRVLGLQFSFHNVQLTDTLREFAASDANLPQEWGGIRLQPKAGLVMEWTRQERLAFYKAYWMQRLWKARPIPNE
jgi:hypothetical protein